MVLYPCSHKDEGKKMPSGAEVIQFLYLIKYKSWSVGLILTIHTNSRKNMPIKTSSISTTISIWNILMLPRANSKETRWFRYFHGMQTLPLEYLQYRTLFCSFLIIVTSNIPYFGSCDHNIRYMVHIEIWSIFVCLDGPRYIFQKSGL